jgi:hypothetical protein
MIINTDSAKVLNGLKIMIELYLDFKCIGADEYERDKKIQNTRVYTSTIADARPEIKLGS